MSETPSKSRQSLSLVVGRPLAIMDSKRKYKIVGFVALLGFYFLIAGSDVKRAMVSRLMVVYITGAWVAFWARGDPIGTFCPITMRPLCILIGVVMMPYGCAMTLFV